MQSITKKSSWKNVQQLSEAEALIDRGVLLGWSEGKGLVRSLTAEDQDKLVRHFAVRLAERGSDRLSAEILIESVLVHLTIAAQENLMLAFLEELLQQPQVEDVCRSLVEITLTSEVADESIEHPLFATAVALICEMGLALQAYDRAYPGQVERLKALLDHIATYLLSVSNTTYQAIRLSLLRYFSITECNREHKLYFSRIINRFGHSVFDSLFQQLFKKKSEGVALQFLLENIPCALETTGDCQVILHETFKHYMLKDPERFSLFVHALGDHLEMMYGVRSSEDPATASFFRHLVSLLKVSADLNHKNLAKEMLSEIFKFGEDPAFKDLITALQASTELRRSFRELIVRFQQELPKLQTTATGSVSQFRADRRGRKPTMARQNQQYGFLQQVFVLGQNELPKAS